MTRGKYLRDRAAVKPMDFLCGLVSRQVSCSTPTRCLAHVVLQKMAVSRDRVITEDSVTSEELREEQEHFQKVVNAFLHYR